MTDHDYIALVAAARCCVADLDCYVNSVRGYDPVAKPEATVAVVTRLADAVEALVKERVAAEEQVIAIEGPGIPWDAPVPEGYTLTAAAVNARIAKARLARGEALTVVRELRQELAIAGVEGSPPPGGDPSTIQQLLTRARTAEARVAELEAEAPAEHATIEMP